MNVHRGTLLGSTALLALLSYPAYAQDDVDTVETEVSEDEPGDKVVVTGSRIRQDTFSSPVAIDVLEVEDAKVEGIADISGLLQSATAASGSTQITNAVSTGFVANGGVGAETVGLRGLGANRTLDLVNGRRAGPSGTRGSVSSFDLGSIPLVGVERVDILKDGASSVYGSDAIAGVINYITDKSDSKSVDFFTSLPGEGAGEVFRASATYGETFDNSRFRVTADYYKAKELARKDRDYLDCDTNYSFTDSSFSERADFIDPRTGQPQCSGTIWGQVWVYDYGSDNIAQNPRNLIFQYDYPGDNLGNFLPEIPTSMNGGLVAPPGWYQVEYNGSAYDTDHTIGSLYEGLVTGTAPNAVTNLYSPVERNDSVTPEVERITLMGDYEHEFGNGITAYAEGLFNRRTNYVNAHKQYWTYQYGESAFGTPNPETVGPGWGGDLSWFSPTPIVEHGDEEVTVDYYRAVAGLRGQFSESLPLIGSWDWDVYGQYSDSHGEYWEQHVRADAIFPYNFVIGDYCSAGGATTPGASGTIEGETVTIEGVPCTPVRWFDPQFLAGELTDAERTMLLDSDAGYTDFEQTTFEGFISGDVIELPAGTLGAAVGLFYQKDEIYDRPSDTTLLGNEFFGSSAGITTGTQETQAVFGELSVPILRDKPLFQYLSVAVSGRYSEITSEHQDGRSITVDGTNYRATLDWRVNDIVRFRASQGTSFRAPGLFEQFLADESSSLRQSVDPCIGWGTAVGNGDITQQVADNCAAEGIPDDYSGAPISATVLQGGGFGVLEPEESENFTIGAVFTPHFDFADVSFAVDYFDITVLDEIDTLTATQIVNGCYSSENFATEPLCDLVDRGFELTPPDPTVPNRIAEVRATFINVNEQVNQGIDYTLQVRKPTKFGDLSIFAQASNQLEDEILLLAADSTEFLNGGIGEPKWTGFANVTLEPSSALTLRWSMDWIGEMEGLRDIYSETEDYSGEAELVDGYYTISQENVDQVFWKTKLEQTIYHGVSAQYVWEHGVTLRAGVNNLFDEHPPATSYSASAGNTSLLASQHDLLGRRFFFNLTKEF